MSFFRFHKDFKIKAVKQYYEEYLNPQEIFIQADFKLETIGKEIPGYCLGRWKKTYQTKGFNALNTENRGKTKGGGRPRKIRDKKDKDKIERLEAENIYLKAENDFLVKLRAKRN